MILCGRRHDGVEHVARRLGEPEFRTAQGNADAGERCQRGIKAEGHEGGERRTAGRDERRPDAEPSRDLTQKNQLQHKRAAVHPEIAGGVKRRSLQGAWKRRRNQARHFNVDDHAEERAEAHQHRDTGQKRRAADQPQAFERRDSGRLAHLTRGCWCGRGRPAREQTERGERTGQQRRADPNEAVDGHIRREGTRKQRSDQAAETAAGTHHAEVAAALRLAPHLGHPAPEHGYREHIKNSDPDVKCSSPPGPYGTLVAVAAKREGENAQIGDEKGKQSGHQPWPRHAHEQPAEHRHDEKHHEEDRAAQVLDRIGAQRRRERIAHRPQEVVAGEQQRE